MALAIVAFLAVLIGAALTFRVRVYITYDGEWHVRIYYLFFNIRMKGPVEGKAKKAKQKPKRQTDIRDVIRIFRKFSSRLGETLKIFLRSISVDKLIVEITVCEEDAFATAMLYGEACGAVYTAAAFLEGFTRIRKREISVTPVFGEGESSFHFETAAGIRLGSFLAIANRQAIGILVSLIKENLQNKYAKDGALK